MEEGKVEGKEEQAIETAKIAIKEGMSDELIAKLIGLTESQVNIIRKSINNARVKGYRKRYPFSIKKVLSLATDTVNRITSKCSFLIKY